MKAIKKLFKRKPKKEDSNLRQSEDVQTNPTQEGNACESIEQTRPHSNVRTVPEAPRANAPINSPAKPPVPQPSVSTAEKSRSPQFSGQAIAFHKNATRTSSTKTTPSTSFVTRSLLDLGEIKVSKGGADSFRKGLNTTQRSGVCETTEELVVPDPNNVGKLGDAYDSIPLLEQTKLPRGGISIETKAAGRIQVSFS
jgi:hypothetical protein